LGDSKIIKKFQRLLAECEEEHIYQGKILEFIKVDYISEDRFSTGMVLTGSKGTSKIDFSSGYQKYFENASAFAIGDEVVVLGKQTKFGHPSMIPSIILIPEKQTLVFSREPESYKSEGWTENARIICMILALIFAFISWISNDVSYLFDRFFIYWEITLLTGIAAFLFIVLFIAIEIYDRHTRRERVIQCDIDTWNIMNEAVIERFGSIVTPPP